MLNKKRSDYNIVTVIIEDDDENYKLQFTTIELGETGEWLILEDPGLYQ